MGVATTVQTHWRFQSDSANANDAGTLLGSEDTSYEVTLDTTYFVRVKVENSGGKNEDSQVYQIQYDLNDNNWVNVTTSSSNVRAVAGSDTDGDAMTELLSRAVAAYTNGEYSEDGATAAMVIPQDDSTEHVFSVQFRSADLSGGATVRLRLTGGGGTLDGTYNLVTATTPVTEATVTPGKGDITVFGRAPVEIENDVQPGKGDITLFGRAASTTTEFTVTPGKGDITVLGRNTASHMGTPQVFTPAYRVVRISRPMYRQGTYRVHHFVQYVSIPTIQVEALSPVTEVTVTPGKGDITLSGKPVTLDVTIPVGKADITLGGRGVTLSVTVPVGKGDITVFGRAVTEQVTVPVGKGDITVFGRSVTEQVTVPVGKGDITVLGRQPTEQVEILVGKADITVSGRGVTIQQVAPVGQGSITLSGRGVTLQKTIAVGKGDIEVLGRQVGTTIEGFVPIGKGDVEVLGRQATVSFVAPVTEERESSYGSGQSFEKFERIAREDEMILAVIQEFLDKAA